MPNSARQNFIVKINQCINLLGTVEGYLTKIKDFVKGTEFFTITEKVHNKNKENTLTLIDFLKEINTDGVFTYQRRG